MKHNRLLQQVVKRTAACWLCLLTFLTCFPVHADVRAAEKEESRIIRVGWYDSPFNLMGADGRRSGYAYDYQLKISAYTGWQYEYVSGSWVDLYNMLLEGRIDLLSDVSLTPERRDRLLFSSLPMGSEVYYACVSSGRDVGVTDEDLTSFNGKVIGVNKGTFQEQLLLDWLDRNGIEAEVTELTVSQPEAVAMLGRGEIDVLVDLDIYGLVEDVTPVCMIGSSDIYFAVPPDRPELVNELNSAMVRIQEENRHYNQHLQEKYFNSNLVSLRFSQSEVEWIAAHGAVRVGYLDHWLAFCAQDGETGAQTGALGVYLELASRCMQNAEIVFAPVPFDNADDAFSALRKGEIDCVFPVNLSSYEAETLGILKTEPIMQTEIYAAVRSDKRHHFSTEGNVNVAITETDRNFRTFVMESYPDWSESLYESREACLEAVEEGEADCVLLCNYQLGRTDEELREKGLTPISIGQEMNFSFAVDRRQDCLYSILNKTSQYVPASAIHSALVSYAYEEETFDIVDFLKAHLVTVLLGTGGVLCLILMLMVKSLRSERKAKKSLRALEESLGRERKQQEELDATKDKAYTDPLTGVWSKHAYTEASAAIQRSIDNGEKPVFAVVVFDVNDLKKVNDIYGHEAGDRHILSAKKLICDCFPDSPAYRIGGDEFVVLLTGGACENGPARMEAFDRQSEQNLRNGLTVVSAGYARFDAEHDTSFGEVFRRADEAMYRRKRFLKGGGSGRAAPDGASRDTSGRTVVFECDGVQIRADRNVDPEKLTALIGLLRH